MHLPVLAVAVASAGLLLTACATQAAPLRAPATGPRAARTPAKAGPGPALVPPASTVTSPPRLTSTCTTGVEDQTARVFHPASTVGTPGGLIPAGDRAVAAYRVTVANGAAASAEVSGFVVAFTSGTGGQTGTDTQGDFDRVIAPGGSLTWTLAPWDVIWDAPFAAGRSGAIDTRSHCRVVAWTHP